MQLEKMEDKDGDGRVFVLEQEVKSLTEELNQCQVRVNLSHLTDLCVHGGVDFVCTENYFSQS